MLWPFEFLESLRCSFASISIYHGPHTYTRVKIYGRFNLPRASVFNFDCLDIICAWINIRVKCYDHLNFLRASVVPFRGSRYIMGLKHTSESKVMAVCICLDLTCSISSVLIYHVPKSEIEWNFMYNFESVDILWAWIGHPSEKLWPFEFLERFPCSISSISI